MVKRVGILPSVTSINTFSLSGLFFFFFFFTNATTDSIQSILSHLRPISLLTILCLRLGYPSPFIPFALSFSLSILPLYSHSLSFNSFFSSLLFTLSLSSSSLLLLFSLSSSIHPFSLFFHSLFFFFTFLHSFSLLPLYSYSFFPFILTFSFSLSLLSPFYFYSSPPPFTLTLLFSRFLSAIPPLLSFLLSSFLYSPTFSPPPFIPTLSPLSFSPSPQLLSHTDASFAYLLHILQTAHLSPQLPPPPLSYLSCTLSLSPPLT